MSAPVTIGAATLHLGDCQAVLPTLPPASIDAVVCDPPYHLTAGKKGGTGAASVNLDSPAGRARITAGFMGKEWDGGDIAFRPETWAAVLRVMKPGAHLIAFGGTRTYHRLVCAIEDAGFEIRDQLAWVFGSGMPKSMDVSKAIDKALGADDARGQWQGWGTALKPAFEPVVLARKPLAGTVAANVLAHGTGALNIAGCRVPTDGGEVNPSVARRRGAVGFLRSRSAAESNAEGRIANRSTPEAYRRERAGEAAGRWPANLAHDGSDEVLALFPRDAGASAPVRGTEPSAPTDAIYGERARVPGAFHADRGSAARFFYCAKASRADRNDGCDDLAKRPLLWSSGTQSPGTFQSADTERAARNHHPTVKPTDLMRWLCRLITPPGGVILDPFMGSGSTGRGAVLEGFRFIGIEREPDYVEIARLRIQAAAERAASEAAEAAADDAQGALLA